MKVAIGAVAILFLAVCCPARAQQNHSESDSYREYVTELPAAERVEILAVGWIATDEWRNVDCTKPDVLCYLPHKFPSKILASKMLAGEEANIASMLWRRLKPGNGAGCFSPAYVLRFYTHGEILLTAEVCFHCCNIALPGTMAGICGD
ncbi:MAG TPA: hypothetical protein VGO69_03095, partial [Pyrinomonadaceae bacterium]|nr:hypothetical protein [Pyrinomonadaceae bacterium]